MRNEGENNKFVSNFIFFKIKNKRRYVKAVNEYKRW